MVRIRIAHLALPLGELSPQATERAWGQRLPSPSSLRSATSPKGRGKQPPTWLSLWESCRRRRLKGLGGSAYPPRLRFAQTPLPTGEARGRLLASALRIKRYSRPVFWDESSFLLRGATQIRKFPWNLPRLRRKAGCAARRFRCGAPYTPARRTSFPGRLQKPFSKAAFSLGSEASGTASASLQFIGSIFCFSS